MQKIYLGAIVAAAVLIGYIGLVGFSTQKTEPKELDILTIQSAQASPGMAMFMKIDGIEGESRDEQHMNEIQVESWSWGMSNSGSAHTGGGAGAGKVSVQDLSFTHFVDKSTPQLMLHCANGEHIPEAKLTVRKAGERPLEYFTITMKDVIVTSVSTGGSSGEDLLTENVTLNFAKFTVKYVEQGPGGGPGATSGMGWDITKNKEQ